MSSLLFALECRKLCHRLAETIGQCVSFSLYFCTSAAQSEVISYITPPHSQEPTIPPLAYPLTSGNAQSTSSQITVSVLTRELSDFELIKSTCQSTSFAVILLDGTPDLVSYILDLKNCALLTSHFSSIPKLSGKVSMVEGVQRWRSQHL